ncbi:MAG: VWA domain-containing protein [Acidobacteriota bacterium]|nr:VWA domain-containing protein [Acidobacteriota bacterium]
MKIIFALLFLTLLALPSKLQAQNNEPDTGQETNKSFVSVPVMVSDREGHYIPGLKREDFSVYQDGVKQKINFFSTYNEPLKIALLLDTSKSTRNVIKKIREAAKEFVGSLNANDECEVATFDSQVKIINSFTSNQKVIKNALDKVEINEHGGTLMYNAVKQIAQESFNNVKGRKVIILLTDGNDFGSSVTKGEFMNLLEESDVLIYTVFFKTSNSLDESMNAAKRKKIKKPRKKKKDDLNSIPAQAVYVQSDEETVLLEKKDETEAIDSLKKMSDITAGRFYLSTVPDLKKAFKNITGELTQQYRLGYNSKMAANDAAAHDITVKVDRPDVVVRARGTFRTKRS